MLQPVFAQVDSLKLPVDSVQLTANHKLDSIEGSFNKQVDSLTQSYGQAKSKIETTKAGYQQKIDSLNKLNLPTDKYTHKVDSLNGELSHLQNNATAKIDSLKSKVTSKMQTLNLPPEAQGRVAALTSTMNNVNMPSIDAGISEKIKLGNFNTSVPGLPTEGLDVKGLPGANIPSANIPGGNTGVPTVNTPGTGINEKMDELNKVTDKAGNIQQQVKDGVSAEKAGEALENKASQLDAVKTVQEQAKPEMPGGMPAEMPANSDQAKEQLKDMAKKEAVNHFAGKEAALTTAMDKISKYKQKYNSVSSIKDLPDKKPNPMKDKTFAERLVPGITLQFQSFRYFMLDINGSVGFRFTEHITAGLGWNQRFAYSLDEREFSPSARIFGVRSYGEYHFKKGFALRADIECMNTLVQQTVNGTPEQGYREWVWSALTGVKQEYKITRNLKGNAQVLYNLFDPHHKSPYTDRLNIRMGFEYVIRKKKK